MARSTVLAPGTASHVTLEAFSGRATCATKSTYTSRLDDAGSPSELPSLMEHEHTHELFLLLDAISHWYRICFF